MEQVPSRNYGLVRAVWDFPTAGSHSCTCTSSHYQATTFESRIHKVAIKPPYIIEWLAGVQFSVLFLLQIYVVQLLASTIATFDDTMMRFFCQFAFLHLQLQGFSTSISPGIQARDTRLSPLVGQVWE